MVNDKQRVSLVFVIAVIFFLIHKIVPVIGYNTPAIVNIANLAYIYAYLLFKSGIGIYMKSGMLMIFGVFLLLERRIKGKNLVRAVTRTITAIAYQT